MPDSQVSNPDLKVSKDPFMSLKSLGIRLYNLAPLTCSEASLALLTAAGELVAMGGTSTVVPRLSLFWKGKLNPPTIPLESFQIKIIWYLSRRLSWEYMPSLASLSH